MVICYAVVDNTTEHDVLSPPSPTSVPSNVWVLHDRTKPQRTKSQPLVLDVGVQTFLIYYTCMHGSVSWFMYTVRGQKPLRTNPPRTKPPRTKPPPYIIHSRQAISGQNPLINDTRLKNVNEFYVNLCLTHLNNGYKFVFKV